MKNDGQGEPLGVSPRLIWFNGEWYIIGEDNMKKAITMSNNRYGADSVKVEYCQKPIEKTMRKHNRKKAVSAKSRKKGNAK